MGMKRVSEQENEMFALAAQDNSATIANERMRI